MASAGIIKIKVDFSNVCANRFCKPELGELGCDFIRMNLHAVDADDFISVFGMEDCPVMRKERKQELELALEEQQYADWLDYIITAGEWDYAN